MRQTLPDAVADLSTRDGVSKLNEPALSPGGVVALLVASDAYCWNSHQHNIRSAPALCDSQANATAGSGVLSYSYGSASCSLVVQLTRRSFADFDAHITHDLAITPCSGVYHGTYDMGHRPSTALFLAGSPPAVSLAAVHEGPDGSSDPGGCGLANKFQGIMLDSWRLPRV